MNEINRLTGEPIHWPLSADVNRPGVIDITWCGLVGLDPQVNFALVC